MNNYDKAIETIGKDKQEAAAYLCNRAMCHLNVENYRTQFS